PLVPSSGRHSARAVSSPVQPAKRKREKEVRMKSALGPRPALYVLLVLAFCLSLNLAVEKPEGSAGSEAAKHYVCAPCGMECDARVYDKPGDCPVCGARLIEQKAAEAMQASRLKVGILLFNGVEIIDYTGPWEVFGAADFDVFTVAATKDPVT